MKKYTWDIVTESSSIVLKAKYHLYGNVIGRFSQFSGNVITEESFTNPEISILIKAGSIDTQNASQDEQFKSSAYFSVLEYPVITFQSLNGCGLSAGGIQELTGELAIKGISRAITLVVNFSKMKSFPKSAVALFHLYCHARFKNWQLGLKNDYGISDDVLFVMEISLVRKRMRIGGDESS